MAAFFATVAVGLWAADFSAMAAICADFLSLVEEAELAVLAAFFGAMGGDCPPYRSSPDASMTSSAAVPSSSSPHHGAPSWEDGELGDS